MNLFSKLLQATIERYFLNLKSKESFARSLRVLNDMRPVLAETNHAMLFHKLTTCLPKLFGFEKAAILLKQLNDDQLYVVHIEND